MEELIIHIPPDSNGEGYHYDIYAGETELEYGDPIDGGLCTSTVENALEMAVEQAKTIIKNLEK